MKLWMAIFLVILMIGVTPTFAADSPADQQAATSTAVKQINGDKDVSQVTDSSKDMVTSYDVSNPADEDSSYIDGYDDDGNYIGNYMVVNPSDDESDETDNYTVSSFNMPGEDIEYIDEPDSSDIVDSASVDESDNGTGDDLLEVADTINENTDYAADAQSHPDENNNFDELNEDDQFDEDGYIVTELDIEFEDDDSSDVDQLNESLNGGVIELDDGNYTVVDPADVPLSETTSQIDTDVSNNCKPLIVTIVNGLCGLVQATLEGLGNVCMILGNELETIL